MNAELFNWVVLPALIFLARVCDVSVGTFRLFVLSRGKKSYAALLGFIEISIWLLAMRQIMLNLANPACFLAYAGGFAAGIYVGMLIDEKVAIGYEVIRVITKQDGTELITRLQQEGYGVTSMPATGSTGVVHVIFTTIKRTDVPRVLALIEKFNPKAFYTIESVRTVQEGIFPRMSVKNK